MNDLVSFERCHYSTHGIVIRMNEKEEEVKENDLLRDAMRMLLLLLSYLDFDSDVYLWWYPSW